MPEYIAPLRDMQFALNELADLEKICNQIDDENVSPDVVSAVLEEAGRLASEVLSPLNRVGDLNPAVVEDNAVKETKGFGEAYKQFAEGGWSAMPCPPAYGGMGMSEAVAAATGEMWAASNMAFALCPMLTMGAIGAISTHASEELKQKFLPKMVSGEWTGTMNLTEPQAGSDLAAVRSKAVPDGDAYRISGTKIFITWGDHQMTDNIVHLVLARLPDAPDGVKGISLFIVPKFLVNDDGSLGERNDVYAGSVEHKMGIHGSPTCVMNFGEGEGAIGYLVGEPHQGLVYMFVMMNMARLHVGIQGVSIADRAYQAALDYAKNRVQGAPLTGGDRCEIIQHPDVRRMLLQMRAMTEAARAITYVVSAEFDNLHAGDESAQAKIDYLTPIAKGWATEIAQEVTYLAVQVHGGMGFVEETGVAQYQRDARIITIYEGTTGIQAMDLTGRKLVRDMGKNIKVVLTQMHTELAAFSDDGEFGAMKQAVQDGLKQVEEVARWIGENVMKDMNVIGTAASNFLMLNGTAFGAFYLLKSANIANAKADEYGDFAVSKLATTRFYCEHILPRADAFRKAAMAPVATTMSLPNEQF